MGLKSRPAPASNKDGGDQSRNACVDVNNGAAREVKRAHVKEPAALGPDPMADGGVDKGQPEYKEDDVGSELESLHNRARDKGGCDDGEHHLECNEEKVRYVASIIDPYSGKANVGEIAYECVEVAAIAECQAVSPEHPDQAGHGHRHKAERNRADGVSSAHQSAVEESEARCHEQHQRRRHQHPGSIAAIELAHPVLLPEHTTTRLWPRITINGVFVL